MENWKQIPIEELRGIEASDPGRIRKGSYIYSLTKHHNGYMMFRVQVNGERKSYLAHRLIATTWIDNPLGKEQVNHINGEKVSNLEWVTNKENQIHSFSALGNKRSEFAGKPKKEVIKLLNGIEISIYESAHSAAKENGLNNSKISMVCRGERNSHGGFQWKYKEEIV